ncbi:NERD domain-containing protein, partial [bacterium]|nr:NERD domain-containing protein [bacterium]
KKTYEGMASPIEQAERHALVVRKLMASMDMPEPETKCFVLVSPKARIDRPKNFDTSRVVKADQFLTAYMKDLEQMSLVKAVFNFARTDSVADVAARLVGYHKPKTFNYAAKFGLESVPAEAIPESGTNTSISPTHGPQCRHCRANTLAVQHGKFGYYFKCDSCMGNTPIKVSCGQSGHKERIRKEGTSFYRECADCGTSEVYFKNAS